MTSIWFNQKALDISIELSANKRTFLIKPLTLHTCLCVIHIQASNNSACVHYSTSCSLQVHHRPAGAPGGDPPPHSGLNSGPHNCHHAHCLPLPPETDSKSAPAPQRPLHVQEHVVSVLIAWQKIGLLDVPCRPNTTEENCLETD